MRCCTYYFDDFSVASFRSEIIDSMAYLVITDGFGVVIDPHEDQDMLKDLSQIMSLSIILTHEHFDHISGVNWLKEHFDATVYASAVCAERIESKRNGTELFPLLLINDKKAYREFKDKYQLPYRCEVNSMLSNEFLLNCGKCQFYCFETPGHTEGSMSVLVNNTALFAGDVLLGNGEEFRSIDANIERYQMVTLPKFISLLSNDVTVFPGHGTPDSLSSILRKQGFYNGS